MNPGSVQVITQEIVQGMGDEGLVDSLLKQVLPAPSHASQVISPLFPSIKGSLINPGLNAAGHLQMLAHCHRTPQPAQLSWCAAGCCRFPPCS